MSNISRRKTRQITLGGVRIGGEAPIVVQTMTTTDTRDVPATTAQILRLEEAGAEVVRVAVPDAQAAGSLGAIKKSIHIPLVADIHFDYRLALTALEQGVDGLRINPGNIGKRERVEAVVRAAKDRSVPIRIGVNAGSLEEDILLKHDCRPTAEALVESALRHVRILEDLDFHDIKISLKSSDVMTTVEAYRAISRAVDYPLHLGVTEAGTTLTGSIKSAVAMGILLAEGIGDTIRVSLTADSAEEVRVGYEILKAVGLRQRGLTLVSCPSCGRAEIDVVSLAQRVEQGLADLASPLTVAVMGCVGNGPGEAREADVGIAGGKGAGVLIKKGEAPRKVTEAEMAERVIDEARRLAGRRR